MIGHQTEEQAKTAQHRLAEINRNTDAQGSSPGGEPIDPTMQTDPAHMTVEQLIGVVHLLRRRVLNQKRELAMYRVEVAEKSVEIAEGYARTARLARDRETAEWLAAVNAPCDMPKAGR